jgi:hypothetical protein
MSDAVEPTPIILPAWRRTDPALERMAVAFWRTLDLPPPGVAPEARAWP